jgi:hypothetical protein
MKDFMLIFRSRTDLPQLSPHEMQSNMQQWFSWIDKLKKENLYVAGEALMQPGKVVKGEQPVVTDGPFTESKEIVGGFFVVKANSFEDASELAKDCPDLPRGTTVEVREVMKF